MLAAILIPGLALSTLGLATPAEAAPRKAARAEQDPLSVQLDALTPSIPTKGRITISGTVTNTTAEAWGAVNLHAFRSLTPILDTASLATSAALEPDEFVGERIVEPGSFETVETLAPGQVQSFTLSFPVSQLEVSEDGVYWIGVHARSGEETYGRARTFIPLESLAKNQSGATVSVVVPIRAGVWFRPDGSLDRVGRWTRWLSPGGRLHSMLELGAPQQQANVSFLVDPAVLAAVTRLSNGNPPRSMDTVTTPEPTETATPDGVDEPVDTAPTTPVSPGAIEGTEPNQSTRRAQQAATEWLATFRSVSVGRDLLALPYGDIDAASAAQHAPDTLATAQARSADVMTQLGLTARPTLAPRTGVLPASAVAQTSADTLLLLSDSALPLVEPSPTGTYLLDGRTVLVTSNGAAAGGPRPGAADDPLALRQRLLAEAAVRLESGSTAPVVLSLPADWNPERPERLLEGLAQPWLSVAPASEVAAGAPAAASPEDLLWTEADEEASLPEYVYSRASELLDAATLTEEVVTQQTTIVGQVSDEILAALSETRRPRPQESGFRMSATERRLLSTFADITVEVPPAVTLTSSSGPVGTTIVNSTDLSVTVRIAAESEPGLALEKAEPLTLAPQSRRRVLLDMKTTRDGRYDVEMLVTSESGVPLGATATLPVRSAVVADGFWIVAAVGAGLLFIMVVYRIARRVKDVRAGEPVRPPVWESEPETESGPESESGRESGPDASSDQPTEEKA